MKSRTLETMQPFDPSLDPAREPAGENEPDFQRKCLVGSVIAHLLLLVIVLTAPAFMRHEPGAPAVILHLRSAADIEAILQPHAPLQEASVPEPPAPQIEPPRPPRPAIRFDESNTKTFKVPTQPQKQSRPDLSKVTEALRKSADASRSELAENLSTKVQIDIPQARTDTYALQVWQAYDRVWRVPQRNLNGEVCVNVSIRADGTVASSRIGHFSGSEDLRASVQSALEKVSFVAPLPASYNTSEKTFTIAFKAEAK